MKEIDKVTSILAGKIAINKKLKMLEKASNQILTIETFDQFIEYEAIHANYLEEGEGDCVGGQGFRRMSARALQKRSRVRFATAESGQLHVVRHTRTAACTRGGTRRAVGRRVVGGTLIRGSDVHESELLLKLRGAAHAFKKNQVTCTHVKQSPAIYADSNRFYVHKYGN